MTSPTYAHRSLEKAEAEALHAAIKRTVNITGYTTGELLRFSNCIVAYVENEFAAACISIALPGNWIEIAVLYVFETFQNTGIGTELFEMAWTHACEQKKHIYTTSRNPIVIRMMKRKQMQLLPLYRLPFQVQIHNIGFIFSLYRIRESIRKGLLRKSLPPFLYGVWYANN